MVPYPTVRSLPKSRQRGPSNTRIEGDCGMRLACSAVNTYRPVTVLEVAQASGLPTTFAFDFPP